MNAVHVEVTDAGVTFGDECVFRDFTARFPGGRITALVGPSGSGKSTLLAILAGYARLTTGRVAMQSVVDGTRALPDASRVAWVPQGSNALGRRSVIDNVAVAALSSGLALREAHAQAKQALDTVGLGALADAQARSLSGGELQRVAFARALASRKGLILADEPSANLDAGNTEVISGLLRGLTADATIVVATHDPLLIDSAEFVVGMRRGATRVD
ncbi:ATP-binding cassette domain-containing protein [Demequina flava]|uniref:ATP-binding cassette domain-containing protein n=1 Tax=Demequina flava TaxID=1095025 RepID=UPI000785A4FC|nr:ATP-binding cassette domain-containing protein [Demequina flava]